MTNKEFKAWFEGFTEALSGTPTKAQWARIKERVAEINGDPITERVFIDRWYNRYPLYWQSHYGAPSPTVYYSSTTSTASDGGTSLLSRNRNVTNTSVPFANSMQAMYAAGKAEAQAA